MTLRTMEQLEEDQRETAHLVHRMKALVQIVKTDQEGDLNDAAHQALAIVRTKTSQNAVKALIALLVSEEVDELKALGADFPMHTWFPEVVFSGASLKDREEGAQDTVSFAPGAEASVTRALKMMGSVGGEYGFDERGAIQFTVVRKQLDLPQVASIQVPLGPKG